MLYPGEATPVKVEDALVEVWRQALADNARDVTVGGQQFPVKRTSRHRLRQVDFQVNGQQFRGLEQNPETASRWAQMAREGKKVMQFLRNGRYIAVVADGKVFTYSRNRGT
jgi:hypothetical protein